MRMKGVFSVKSTSNDGAVVSFNLTPALFFPNCVATSLFLSVLP